MKVVFMGTPEFAAASLRALLGDSGCDLAAAFCQPDKPKGRGYKPQTSPVKELALQSKIPVYQPVSLKSDSGESLRILREINPDVIAVAAYGKILPKEILELPKYGCINAHASLLPDYRGASPINFCIINGETQTGITIMHMSEELDAGDIISREIVQIGEKTTYTELYKEMSEIGANLLAKTLRSIENGTAKRFPQGESSSPKKAYASVITKNMRRIDWNLPAREIYNFIRGLSETPAAYTVMNGKRLKIFFSEIAENTGFSDAQHSVPGQIIPAKDFYAVCGNKTLLRLADVCPEGGKRMSGKAFINGNKPGGNTVLN